MIKLIGVAKTFGSGATTVDAVRPLDLDVHDGEFLSLIGPSGCGKSTVLRMIAGLERPTQGSIAFAGGSDNRVGFVFQEPVLLPWLTALENIRFPLDTAGRPRAEADAVAHRLAALVGLSDFTGALPKTLSGGMRQRVAIARALSYDPALLLMDEPFGALDLLTRDRLNDELLAIWTATGKTVVLVTHSVEEAAYLSDRVVVMSARPGEVRAVHTVPFARPRGEATKLDPRFADLMATLRRELH